MNTLGPIETFQNFAPPPEKEARDKLGQEDFLTLMISQFRNQDPFEPLDNGEFLGQLAQFSTVNGISSLNSAFEGLAGSMQDNQALQAAGLVGHSVLAVTDIAHLEDDASVKGGIELESSAGNVQIDVTNGAGELVRQDWSDSRGTAMTRPANARTEGCTSLRRASSAAPTSKARRRLLKPRFKASRSASSVVV